MNKWQNNPVRVWIYGLIGPLAAVAVGYGLLTGEQAALWIGVATAVISVPVVEAARSKVTPWPPPPGRAIPDLPPPPGD